MVLSVCDCYFDIDISVLDDAGRTNWSKVWTGAEDHICIGRLQNSDGWAL